MVVVDVHRQVRLANVDTVGIAEEGVVERLGHCRVGSEEGR